MTQVDKIIDNPHEMVIGVDMSGKILYFRAFLQISFRDFKRIRMKE